MGEDDQRTFVVGHADPARRHLATAACEAGGLVDAGEATGIVDLLALVRLTDPAVVVLERRLGGLDPAGAIREVADAAPRAAVVVLTDDLSGASVLTGAGAAAVARDGDRDDVEAAVATALAAIDGERGAGGGRRSGTERRIHQDWSKVTSERRSGDDRRGDDRRTSPRGDETP